MAAPSKPFRLSANDRRFLKSLRISTEDLGMKGERINAGDHGVVNPGDYWINGSRVWECCTPNGRRGTLEAHQVEEHEDGSITVRPSIEVDPLTKDTHGFDRPGWHGWLVKGVWTEC